MNNNAYYTNYNMNMMSNQMMTPGHMCMNAMSIQGPFPPDALNGPGNQFSDYELLMPLGEGSFGSCYKVLSKKDSKVYCMKKMKPEANLKESFEEIKVLLKLNHKNVMKYITHFMDGQSLCIVTGLAENGDVSSYIKLYKEKLQKKIPEENIWGIMLQAMEGLVYIHTHPNKLIHRDIKPANLFMSNRKEILIGDFGLSKVTYTNYTSSIQDRELILNSKEIAGTPRYMGPEMIVGMPIDQRFDVFSMGASFFELCFFDWPHIEPVMRNGKKDWPRNLNEVKYSNFKPNDPKITGYSQELIGLIYQMLTINPEQRITSLACLNQIKQIYLTIYNKNSSIDVAFRCFHSCAPINIFFKDIYSKSPQDNTKIASNLMNHANVILNNQTRENYKSFVNDARATLASINNDFLVAEEIELISLMNYLQKQIHSELNKRVLYCQSKLYQQDPEFNYYCMFFQKNFRSIISDKFYGTMKVNFNCNSCKYQFWNYESFSNIIIDIQEFRKAFNGRNNLTIFDFFQYNNSKVDLLDVRHSITCVKCNRITNHQQRKNFYILPNLILIFIKNNENMNCMQFPIFNLNISNFVEMKEGGTIMYDLISVVNKIRKNDGTDGYVSFHRSPLNNVWYSNDFYGNLHQINNQNELGKEITAWGKNQVLLYQKKN